MSSYHDVCSCSQKEALSSDHRKQFQNELNTLSGALKAKYDEINKEYQGISFLILSLPRLTILPKQVIIIFVPSNSFNYFRSSCGY